MHNPLRAVVARLSPPTNHWYCFGWTPDDYDTPMIYGPKDTEAEVTQIAEEQNLTGPDGGEPIITDLPTTDQSKAVREIKAMLIEQGVRAMEALKRVKRMK